MERPEKIRRQMEMGFLKDGSFSSREVAQLWDKAVRGSGDAKLQGISVDGGIQAAYTAAFNACLAVLALHGLRTGSARGHHENVFYAVSAFGIPGLDDIVSESTEFRSLRAGSMYDPAIGSEQDRQNAVKWMVALLPRIRSALVGWDPSLEAFLAAP